MSEQIEKFTNELMNGGHIFIFIVLVTNILVLVRYSDVLILDNHIVQYV